MALNCRGSLALGNACGFCPRCQDERAQRERPGKTFPVDTAGRVTEAVIALPMGTVLREDDLFKLLGELNGPRWQAVTEFVNRHCKNGGKSGRADYITHVSLDKLESLLKAVEG